MSNAGFDYKAQVLAATDIVDLIGQSVALKKRGRTFSGLCPFHQEKTPSFHVNPAKQFFHCFGCKASGNAIDFVMKRDRIEFIDALKLLGQRANIEMPKFGVSKQKTGEREVLLEAHSAAAALFEKLLSHPNHGQAARDYLASRGFNAQTTKKFQVGVALDSWDTLLTSLGRKFNPQQLALAGLVKGRERGGGFYDTFRNRLMFPIRDEQGRIIAFGGRVMPGSEDPAKYLNSPETPLFSKSRCIFGLDLGRQRIVETRTVCIVEGYTDVMMAHQFGVSNVVSILGTALTEDHLRILKRFADRIVFLFDADAAGSTAVERSIELALMHNIDIGIASLPEGVDPDEFLLEHGADPFKALIDDAQDVLVFSWQNIIKRNTVNGELQQDAAMKEYLRPFDRARAYGSIDVIRWGSIILRASQRVGLPPEELNRYLSLRKTLQKEAAHEIRENEPTEPALDLTRSSALERVQGWILGVLLDEPHRWHDVQQVVHVEDFTHAACRRLAEIYWSHQRDEGEPVFAEFLSTLPDPALIQLAVELVDEVEELEDLTVTLHDAVAEIERERKRKEQIKLMSDLRRTSDVKSAGTDEVEILRKLAERARIPDLRRS